MPSTMVKDCAYYLLSNALKLMWIMSQACF